MRYYTRSISTEFLNVICEISRETNENNLLCLLHLLYRSWVLNTNCESTSWNYQCLTNPFVWQMTIKDFVKVSLGRTRQKYSNFLDLRKFLTLLVRTVIIMIIIIITTTTTRSRGIVFVERILCIFKYSNALYIIKKLVDHYRSLTSHSPFDSSSWSSTRLTGPINN